MIVIEKICKDGMIMRGRFEEEYKEAAKRFRKFLFEEDNENKKTSIVTDNI